MKNLQRLISFGLLTVSTLAQAEDPLADMMRQYSGNDAAASSEVKKSKKKKKKKELSEASLQVSLPADTERKPAAAAAPAPSTPAPDSTDDSSGHLLGNWYGARKTLNKVGLEFDFAYKGDFVSNFKGGLKQDSGYLGALDTKLSINLDKMVGATGLSLNFYGLGTHGAKPTEFVGDSFGTSSIQAKETYKLYEAYVRQIMDERLTLIAGVRDLNADFYTTNSSGAFLNSAFGISPSLSATGVNGPSVWPNTALAFTLKYSGPQGFYFQQGTFNAMAGDPEKPYGTHITTYTHHGYLLIAESGYASDNQKYSFGAWTYTDKASTTVDEATESHTWGSYLMLDHPVSSHVNIFFKQSYAQPKVAKYHLNTEAGLVWSAPFKNRPDDKVMFGFATALIAKDHRNLNGTEKSESAFELGYRAKMAEGLNLVPDLQYIMNPGLSSDNKNSVVGLLRVEAIF